MVLCVIDVCHEDVGVETLCAIICLFCSCCSFGYTHPYPVWAVCREVAKVVVVEVIGVFFLVMLCCTDFAV